MSFFPSTVKLIVAAVAVLEKVVSHYKDHHYPAKMVEQYLCVSVVAFWKKATTL